MLFIKFLALKKKMDDFFFNLLIQDPDFERLRRQRPVTVMKILRIIYCILILIAFFCGVFLFWRFFFCSVTGSGSGGISAFIKDNPWTENDTLFALSILTSLPKTAENNVKIPVTPLPNNGAGKMQPTEYLNQTDELHLVSLASNPATPPPFRRGNNVSAASLPPFSEFNFFTLAAVSPPLPQPLMQLTSNVTICGYPQRNLPPRSKVYSTEASCLFRKINGEIN